MEDARAAKEIEKERKGKEESGPRQERIKGQRFGRVET
jgi:hypothetical protein